MTAIQLTPAQHAIRKPSGQNPAPRGDFREEKGPGDDSGPCWMVVATTIMNWNTIITPNRAICSA